MASLKDRLKSKIKPKNQPTSIEAFDQTFINVQLIQGKNQLQQILIYCSWNNSKYNHIKPPKLICKWYNRTEKNLQQIEGIEEQRYQTSVADIGSIIEVTCIPELPDANYEGMPILLKSQPITLATKTQNQANYMLQEGKGKILVHIRQAQIDECAISHNSEALLQFEKNELSLLSLKVGQSKEQQIKRIAITDQYPQTKINRKNPKELLLMWNSHEHCTLWFKNSQIRDTFCLFLKLFVARKSLSDLEKVQQEPKQKIEKVSSEGELEQKQEESQSTAQIIPNEQKQKQDKMENLNTKTSTTQLLQLLSLKEELKNYENENQRLMKELQKQKDITFTLQNKVNETNQRLQSASRNYFELEQQLNSKIQEVNKLNQEINNNSVQKQSKQEEFMYYTNEIKILNSDKATLLAQLAQLKEKCDLIEEQLQLYKASQNCEQQEHKKTYNQLLQEIKKLSKQNQEIRLRHQYQMEEKEQLQDNLKSSRQIIEQIQSEKKYIEKKYESLTNQLNSSSLSPNNFSSKLSNKSGSSSPQASMILEEIPHIPSSSSFGIEKKDSFIRMLSCDSQQRQKQILQLKQHIRQYVEENNYLRGLLSKQKKTSSKTQLKMQLFEVKKIVNRLTQALTEKQFELKQLKQINKELNLRNNQITQQYNSLLSK